MLKALVIKELREAAGIVALAVLAALFVLVSLTGTPLMPYGIISADSFPFLSEFFSFYLCLVVGLLAVALGLRQTAWESGQNTFHFLLHRPLSRGAILSAKIVVGASLVLLLGTLMILGYSAWVAGAGNIATPFFWSMTVPAWQVLVSLLLIYLGAFLSGLRPARWFGSRLGPLLAASIAVWAITWIWWWWLALAVVALFAFIGLSAIFHFAATRDY